MPGALSYGAKHTRAQSMLRRLGAVVLSAAILALGTLAARPQVAMAAVPPAWQNYISTFAIAQVGNGPCPTSPWNLNPLGYAIGSAKTYHSCASYVTKTANGAWCADFAGWVWTMSGVDVAKLTFWAASFTNYGTTTVPQVGDAVLFVDSTGVIQHVALVTTISTISLNGKTVPAVYSVGGNESNVVASDYYPSAPGSQVPSFGEYKKVDGTSCTKGTSGCKFYPDTVLEYVAPVLP